MNDEISKAIDNIVWWIPNRKLRDSLRRFYHYQYNKLNDIENNTLNKKILVSYPHNWLDFLVKDDFIDKLENLIVGLDEESIEVVFTFLNRIIRLYKNNDNSLKYLTQHEINYQKYLDKKLLLVLEFEKYIYYNKFKLPKNIPTGYSIDNNFIGIQSHEYIFNNYLKNINCLEKDILDVGACCGDTSIFLSKFTTKKLYAFEPVSITYNILLDTIVLNKNFCNNIIPVKKALSNYNGVSNIFIPKSGTQWLPGASINNTFNISDTVEEEIDIITLDEFVEKNNIEVGFIKVDIEGEEQNFLRGACNTIKKYIPYILISIYHNPEDFFNIKNIIESYKLNYKFHIIKSVPDVGAYDIVLLCIPNEYKNNRSDQIRSDQIMCDV